MTGFDRKCQLHILIVKVHFVWIAVDLAIQLKPQLMAGSTHQIIDSRWPLSHWEAAIQDFIKTSEAGQAHYYCC